MSIVICSSSDRHITYFATSNSETKKDGKKLEFALQSYSLIDQGWCNAIARSPDSEWIAFTSQVSCIRFVNASELQNDAALARQHSIIGLPLLALCFISNKVLVGGGFDCAPLRFGGRRLGRSCLDRRTGNPRKVVWRRVKRIRFEDRCFQREGRNEGIHNNVILGMLSKISSQHALMMENLVYGHLMHLKTTLKETSSELMNISRNIENNLMISFYSNSKKLQRYKQLILGMFVW